MNRGNEVTSANAGYTATDWNWQGQSRSGTECITRQRKLRLKQKEGNRFRRESPGGR
jgi:hypothetical protein